MALNGNEKGIVSKPGVSGVGRAPVIYQKLSAIEMPKCYMCGERAAVGKFLGKPFCRECVSGIDIN